jgi:hypothetical protein
MLKRVQVLRGKITMSAAERRAAIANLKRGEAIAELILRRQISSAGLRQAQAEFF